MRIAVNTRFLLAGKMEGLGWYTHELVRRMVRAHPEVSFVFFFDRPYDPSFVYGENVTPVSVFPPARHPLLWYLWFEHALPAAMARFRPDAFFSPDGYLSLGSRVPTLLSVHDLFPLQHPEQIPWGPRTYYRYFLPRYIRRADAIATISEYVKGEITDLLQTPQEKIHVAYNAGREVFRPLPEPDRQRVRQRFSRGLPYFFYSGAMHPRKNIPRLIEAFTRFKSQTRAPDLLLLAGRRGWQTGEIDDAYARSSCKEDILFLGYLSEQDLASLVASARAMVYVSLAEGFGLPIIEAMQCGTPVLTSQTTSMPEVAGDAALLVDPFDVGAITQGLLQLYGNADLPARLRPAMEARVRAFNWDVAAEKIFNILQTLAC